MIITAAVSIEWVVLGYSWVFGTNLSDTFAGGIAGGFEKMFLRGISLETVNPFGGNIPELVFVMFQCMFAVITPALIIGAFAERIRFSGFLLFTLLWSILVYNTTAHWVWGGGWMHRMGVIDFAGGTVVHVNAGISALVMAVMLRRRRDYANGNPILPHNIPFVVMGTALLWLGWFGFNAGSGLAADGLAANAFVVTHLATAMAAVSWTAIEWSVYGKPTVVGICTGAVAGLVAITPAAGSVDTVGALFIGAASACVCYVFVARIKPKFRYDDSLDAFGVHGVGGFTGALLTGVFATHAVTGEGGAAGALYGDWHQLWVQLVANLTAAVFSGVVTFALFKLVDKTVGLRVDRNGEDIGLDVSQHGEIAYDR
jgi:Amt family ammonium transporter